MSVVDRIIGFASPAASLRRAIRLGERERGTEAFPLLEYAAKAGIADAEYRVARCYLEGSGVPPSRAEATRWLKLAATHRCTEAQVLLSVLYIQGWAVEASSDPATSGAERLFAADTPSGPDFISAEKWARMAAAAGSAWLCPDQRSGNHARPRRSASVVRAVRQCGLSARPPRLCPVADATRARRKGLAQDRGAPAFGLGSRTGIRDLSIGGFDRARTWR